MGAGRAARKRKRKRQHTIQSSINITPLLPDNVSLLRVVSSLQHSLSFHIFSISVSSVAVCEADDVSPQTRIHLNAAAAGPLHWYNFVLTIQSFCYECTWLSTNICLMRHFTSSLTTQDAEWTLCKCVTQMLVQFL